jgi:hypothetical protein
MRVRFLWAFWMLPAVALGATAPTRPTPAEELDAELAAQVKIPDPELVIVTDGPEPARFELMDGTVELDGRPLPGPMQPGWGKPYYSGAVLPGNHVLTAQFSYRGTPTGAYPWSGAYTYRVPGKVEFQAQRGLRLVVHLRVEIREDQDDPRNRLAFRAALEPEMIAKVDDAPMPPPPPRKIAPEELFAPTLEPAALTTPPPAPSKTKKKPKPKKTSVAANGASLDVATARLQKAIATPVEAPSAKSASKKKPDAGQP